MKSSSQSRPIRRGKSERPRDKLLKLKCMMSIITTAHRTCISRQERGDEVLEVIRIRMTITAMRIITTTMATTITTTEAATTTPTTATTTSRLTCEEEETEECECPHCPEDVAPASAEDEPLSASAGLQDPAAGAGAPEEASSRDAEWAKGSRLVLTR